MYEYNNEKSNKRSFKYVLDTFSYKLFTTYKNDYNSNTYEIRIGNHYRGSGAPN